jgi:hypothetical protein
MSALGHLADIAFHPLNVRFTPAKADILLTRVNVRHWARRYCFEAT